MLIQTTDKTNYSPLLLPPALVVILISLMWLGLTGLVRAVGHG